jgi:hypothetical protein
VADWFRRTSWTEADRDDFEARLRRARPHNRGQYLLLQAGALGGMGEPRLVQAALALLDRMLREYPDRVHVASAHALRAVCLRTLGRVDEAFDAYREALRHERTFPNVRTQAWLDFPLFAVLEGRRDLRDEVVAVLDENDDPDGMPFPLMRFRYHAIRAFVAQWDGRTADARREAAEALRWTTVAHSGFRYHPTVGLVGERDRDLVERLEALAAQST